MWLLQNDESALVSGTTSPLNRRHGSTPISLEYFFLTRDVCATGDEKSNQAGRAAARVGLTKYPVSQGNLRSSAFAFCGSETLHESLGNGRVGLLPFPFICIFNHPLLFFSASLSVPRELRHHVPSCRWQSVPI
jgi:hypothetical protein